MNIKKLLTRRLTWGGPVGRILTPVILERPKGMPPVILERPKGARGSLTSGGIDPIVVKLLQDDGRKHQKKSALRRTDFELEVHLIYVKKVYMENVRLSIKTKMWTRGESNSRTRFRRSDAMPIARPHQ